MILSPKPFKTHEVEINKQLQLRYFPILSPEEERQQKSLPYYLVKKKKKLEH